MNTYHITVDLPEKYASLIGAIIVHWSYQERLLADLTSALLNVSIKHGRVAVRSPRADEYITMIRQLMMLEGVECNSVNLNKLATHLRALDGIRNLVAHGIWFVDPTTEFPAVQNISGNWKPDPKGPKIARRIIPEGVVIDESGFRKIITSIKSTIQTTHSAHTEIVKKLEALRK